VKPIKLFVIPSIAILSTLLGGCSSGILVTSSPVPTDTSLPPTSTIPTTTSTVPPSPAVTPIPSLSPDRAYARIQALLGNSPDCELPCWLGITPGQTTWQEANEQLAFWGGIANRLYIETHAGKWSTGSFTIPNSDNTIFIEIRISYPIESINNIISVISAETRAYKDTNSEFGDVYGYSKYDDLLQQYSIARVLTKYGNPDIIYILGVLRDDVIVSPGFGDYFAIHLWYPDKGIFIAYKMAVERSGTNYRFCPSKAFISGILMPPGSDSNYKSVLYRVDSNYDYFFPPVSKYVETPVEAFNMNDEEFVRLLLSSTDQCLETPVSLWWPK
jgi:hypothetical protein